MGLWDEGTAVNIGFYFYLEKCAERNEQPNQPYSGKLMVRMPVEVHAAVAITAEANGKSINQWIVETLEEAAG